MLKSLLSLTPITEPAFHSEAGGFNRLEFSFRNYGPFAQIVPDRMERKDSVS